MAIQRQKEIGQRRRRRQKFKKLKKRYAKARSDSEKQAIVNKLRKISPFYPIENLS